MKPKTLVLLAVAGGCGLVAMLGVQQVMQGQQTVVKGPTVKVLVALDNIETGVKLTEDNTKFREMPAESVQEDAVRDMKDVEARAARVPYMVGDIIRKSKLTEPGVYGKSINIPPGMRVISIPVDDTHTISGLLQPNDRVDVLVTYQGRGERGSQVSKTKTLLEYVEVFSCDDVTAAGSGEKAAAMRAKNVALLLTPEQAGYVILAQRKGSLSLSWRRRGDDELAQTKDIDEKLMEELQGTVGIHDDDMPLFSQRNRRNPFEDSEPAETPQQFLDETAATPPVVAAPAKSTWTIDVYSGSTVTSHEVEMKPAPENTPAAGTPKSVTPQKQEDIIKYRSKPSRLTAPATVPTEVDDLGEALSAEEILPRQERLALPRRNGCSAETMQTDLNFCRTGRGQFLIELTPLVWLW